MKPVIYPGAGRPLLFGHRGYSSIAPENTLYAFEEILNRKIPGVEFDVHLCSSGELVVTHDHNLKRVTGFDGLVENTDYSVIKKLDAGRWMDDKYAGARIPLLKDVFDLLGSDVYYDIEIKSDSVKKSGIETALFNLIKEYRLEERVVVSSFNPVQLRFFKKHAPHIPAAIIYSDDPEVPWYLRHGQGRWIVPADILKPAFKLIKKGAGKLPVIAWTVDSGEVAERLLSAGVSGIISNKPAELGL